MAQTWNKQLKSLDLSRQWPLPLWNYINGPNLLHGLDLFLLSIGALTPWMIWFWWEKAMKRISMLLCLDKLEWNSFVKDSWIQVLNDTSVQIMKKLQITIWLVQKKQIAFSQWNPLIHISHCHVLIDLIMTIILR